MRFAGSNGTALLMRTGGRFRCLHFRHNSHDCAADDFQGLVQLDLFETDGEAGGDTWVG